MKASISAPEQQHLIPIRKGSELKVDLFLQKSKVIATHARLALQKALKSLSTYQVEFEYSDGAKGRSIQDLDAILRRTIDGEMTPRTVGYFDALQHDTLDLNPNDLPELEEALYLSYLALDAFLAENVRELPDTDNTLVHMTDGAE